jgi:hypothetical protein
MPTINYSASWVDVANDALGILGQPFIQTFGDTSAQALAANAHFANTIAGVLQSHDWRCLAVMVQCQLCANTPAYKWMFAYQLPSDFFRLLDLDVGGDDYEIMSGLSVGVPDSLVVMSNGYGDTYNALGVQTTTAQIINLVYIQMPQDAQSLPYVMKNLIAAELAVAMAPRLVDNEQTISRASANAQQAWADALSFDSRLRKDPKPMSPSKNGVWNDEHRHGLPNGYNPASSLGMIN